MDAAENVGRMYLKGMDVRQIAKELNLPRKEVNAALEDFRGILRRSAESAVDVRDRVMDIIFESDESFRMIIDEGWKTAQQADSAGQINSKVNALKLIESSTKNRADMLQKAGVSQDSEIVEQINQTEERQEVLIKLLKEIRSEYPEVAELITRRLNKIQTEVEPIAIESARDE